MHAAVGIHDEKTIGLSMKQEVWKNIVYIHSLKKLKVRCVATVATSF